MKIFNGCENLSVYDFLEWELEGAKQSWECNPVEEIEPWDKFTINELLEQIAQQVETDYACGILSVIKE